MRYVDPDGRFQIESPADKSKNDPNNNRGFRIIETNWSIGNYLFTKQLPQLFGFKSNADKSRDSGVEGDRGAYAPNGNHNVAPWLLGVQEKNGPKADKKTFEIYQKLFGGTLNDDSLITPINQSYKTVKSRLNLIFGITAYIIGHGKQAGGKYDDGIYLMQGITFDDTIENLSQQDFESILEEVRQQIKSGEIKHEH